MPIEDLLIRKTQSFCPQCFAEIEAKIVERDGGVYLDKECIKHGFFSLLLSCHPGYYKGLSNIYFPLFTRSFPQRDYIIHLTNRCQLNCPICLAGANLGPEADYSLGNLKDFLKGKSGYKFDLMGAEPTMCQDLPEMIRMIENSGNTAALHTNGIKLAEFAYLTKLKEAGLRRVSLSFDGFDETVYEKLRGRKLFDLKKKALDNLKQANIATDLVVTVARGVNEQEMSKVLQYSLKQKFIKGVFFLGYRFMGKARSLSAETCIMPDELIDILEKQSAGRICRQSVFNFQKLYFAFLAAFSMRKCFYNQHFLILRSKKGYSSIDQILNLERVTSKLNNYRRLSLAKNKLAKGYLILSAAAELFSLRGFLWLKELLSFGFWSVKLANLPGRSILIGFISSCDTYSFDSGIARNCGKGTISLKLGVQDCGATNNILADKCRGI